MPYPPRTDDAVAGCWGGLNAKTMGRPKATCLVSCLRLDWYDGNNGLTSTDNHGHGAPLPLLTIASYLFYVGSSLAGGGSVMRDHTRGSDADASLPGELITIPQELHTFRYLSMEYSDFEGFPAPLTNGGTGLQYSDLARLHGYATYGGDSRLIADAEERGVVWEFAGEQKLWAAGRLGDDEVRVLYPGYIEDFPVDFSDSED
ncbi:hypothetical protein DL769_011361 [Monosporascus sp. CRB-8-3]|nr:hypothetical protein DL769_011361 [Monosporascus sp. CRB-8-3]